eukprot:11183434-Alexandrium_andersonii.AAC.1
MPMKSTSCTCSPGQPSPLAPPEGRLISFSVQRARCRISLETDVFLSLLAEGCHRCRPVVPHAPHHP